MQEPHSEGVANHADLESCAGGGEVVGEALTEALAGWVLSREETSSRAPTPCSGAEGNTDGGASASPRRALRGRRPHTRQETPRTRTGRPRAASAVSAADREEKAQAVRPPCTPARSRTTG
jgi:hypothetical protein